MKTENEAYLTLAALCAQAEHCQWEMTEKMRRWELDDEAQARVMERLVKGGRRGIPLSTKASAEAETQDGQGAERL